MTQQAFATPAELAEALLAAPELLGELVAPLSAADASALVDHLKNEADRHWWINANQSLVFADLIVQIGRLRGDAWQTALGTMARGDALKFVGNIQEAWDLLGEAGALFESIGDAVGWARTRIGRMLISVELSRVDEALADAERAREVFVYNHIQDKLLVLELNTAIVYNLLGDQQKALQLYFGALELARSLGPAGERWIGPIHTNIGNVYNKLGNFRQAISYHEQAQQYFLEREEFRGVALAKYNSAHIMMQEGSYQNALRLLHQSREYYLSEGMIKDAINVNRDLIEIYLTLGKYSEARSAANEVINNYQENASNYQKGVSLLLLSDAENALKNFEDAKISIDDALQIFSSLDAKILVGRCAS